MPKKPLSVIDAAPLAQLLKKSDISPNPEPSPGTWVKILRAYLRMTQDELSSKTGIAQSHLADIEAGKIDPQVSTLRRIFNALSCDVLFRPSPLKPLPEVLRGRARAIAQKRLKQSTGSMALEKQAPDPDLFRALLEKRTDEILDDKRERLWDRQDE